MHMCGNSVAIRMCVVQCRKLAMKKENKRREEREGVHLRAGEPWCVTMEEAFNNSHDIDLVTLLPTSLPRPRRRSPPVGSCSPNMQ